MREGFQEEGGDVVLLVPMDRVVMVAVRGGGQRMKGGETTKDLVVGLRASPSLAGESGSPWHSVQCEGHQHTTRDTHHHTRTTTARARQAGPSLACPVRRPTPRLVPPKLPATVPSSIMPTTAKQSRPSSACSVTSSTMGASDLPPNVHCSGHPLLQHKMTLLRDRKTTTRDFRHLMRELTLYLGYEATTEITLRPRKVEGTLGPVAGHKLSDKIAIVPILRGGLGMIDAMTEILPNAAVYHIGMFSNHRSSSLPIQYYNRLPKEKDQVADLTFVLDPLIATAGTCSATVSQLKKWGTKKIVVIGVVGATKGLHKLMQAHPDIKVHVAAIDEAVSEDGHILPGIGDASERLFNAYMGEGDDEMSVVTSASKKPKGNNGGSA